MFVSELNDVCVLIFFVMYVMSNYVYVVYSVVIVLLMMKCFVCVDFFLCSVLCVRMIYVVYVYVFVMLKKCVCVCGMWFGMWFRRVVMMLCMCDGE